MNARRDELVERVFQVPGQERIAVMEELINLADADNRLEEAYGWRRELIRLANGQGFPEKAIVAFSWCLAQFDRHPELDEPESLMWEFKVILELVPVFAKVTRGQIMAMQEDMARRLAELGQSERTAHYYRSWNFMRMGEYEIAMEYQEKYLNMRRTASSDCVACERDRQVELLSRLQRDEEALDRASPVLSGKMRCAEIPAFTNAHICRSLLRLGRVDEAAEIQAGGYDAVQKERKYLGTIGDLMLVLVRTRQFDAAIRQMIRHLPWANETAADELRLRFFSAVALLLETFASENPRPRKLPLPRTLGCWKADETYEPAALAKWFHDESLQLVAQFNRRNQNETYGRILEENRSLCGLN